MSYKKKCKFCGKEFEPNRDWQKFCSRSHQREYWKGIREDRISLADRLKRLEEKLGMQS